MMQLDDHGLQDVCRDDGMSAEALYVADVSNHAQWFYTSAIEDPDAWITAGCEGCSDIHTWRRVYVKV